MFFFKKNPGCHVQIPPLTTPSENVVVFGEESQILNALKMILDKVCLFFPSFFSLFYKI